MTDITPYLPFIIPLGVLQLGLMAAALIHIFTHKAYRFGNRTLWVIVCVLLNMIGPVLYFCIGRSDEGNDE